MQETEGFNFFDFIHELDERDNLFRKQIETFIKVHTNVIQT